MVFTLVLPIAVQQLINACITSADIMMLGRVSESAIAGVSLAGQVSFLLNLILIGISSGASILCSQYWGKKDLRSIEELMGFSLCAGLFFSVIFTVTAFCAPLSVMGLFTSDPVIADQGAQYLRIVCFSYPLNCGTFIYLSIMRSMEHVKISFIIYLFSLLINVFLNYIFIFGHFGSPALGTAGAAAGTCGARLFEPVSYTHLPSFMSHPVFFQFLYRSADPSYNKHSASFLCTSLLLYCSYTLTAFYPFTAPAVIPDTTCSCIRK